MRRGDGGGRRRRLAALEGSKVAVVPAQGRHGNHILAGELDPSKVDLDDRRHTSQGLNREGEEGQHQTLHGGVSSCSRSQVGGAAGPDPRVGHVEHGKRRVLAHRIGKELAAAEEELVGLEVECGEGGVGGQRPAKR